MLKSAKSPHFIAAFRQHICLSVNHPETSQRGDGIGEDTQKQLALLQHIHTNAYTFSPLERTQDTTPTHRYDWTNSNTHWWPITCNRCLIYKVSRCQSLWLFMRSKWTRCKRPSIPMEMESCYHDKHCDGWACDSSWLAGDLKQDTP